MGKRLTLIVLVIAVCASVFYLGSRNWRLLFGERPAARSSDAPQIESIVAQGRILPFGGLLNIAAPPGQRIDELLVAVGDQVTGGQTELAKLAGRELLELQVRMATAKRADAELEIDQRIVAADINVHAAQAARETARLQLEQIRSRTDQEIAEKQIAAAGEKLERLRRLAADPLTKNLVSLQDIADQTLLLEKANFDKQRADTELRQASETAELALANAEANVVSAQRSLELANQMRNANQSLALAETVAKAQLEASRLIAPANGTVLKVFVRQGEVAVNQPLMQIGDLTRMECLAEVNDRLVRQVRVGQRATIRSAAFPRDLSGTVRDVSPVVGTSTLPNPNPLAMVDTKTVDVRIEIDPADIAEAAALVHLQATVEIDPKSAPADSQNPMARTVGQR